MWQQFQPMTCKQTDLPAKPNDHKPELELLYRIFPALNAAHTSTYQSNVDNGIVEQPDEDPPIGR